MRLLHSLNGAELDQDDSRDLDAQIINLHRLLSQRIAALEARVTAIEAILEGSWRTRLHWFFWGLD